MSTSPIQSTTASGAKVPLSKRVAAARSSATARILSPSEASQSDPARETVSTAFGTFYVSPATHRLLATIAYAEAAKVIAEAIERFDREAVLAGLRSLPSLYSPELTPSCRSSHEAGKVLMEALETQPAPADLMIQLQKFKHYATTEYHRRGHGQTDCERVPKPGDPKPWVPSGRPYGQWLAERG